MRKLSLIILFISFTNGLSGVIWTSPSIAQKERDDFLIQGEYVSKDNSYAAQVIALDQEKFEAFILDGGLPGQGWNQKLGRQKLTGRSKEGGIYFTGDTLNAVIQSGKMELSFEEGNKIVLSKIFRVSPTYGLEAPEGAIVLFDGTNVDSWTDTELQNGLLKFGAKSKETFKNYRLHLEFRLPYKPKAKGQARGNSGFFHGFGPQKRLELQILDSFGLSETMNHCGAIYKVASPLLNMSYPPLQWQTYDIEYMDAVFKDGKLISSGIITVRHNGVVIHEKLKIPAKRKEQKSGIFYLQDHKNPVFFKNIWVVEK